MTQRREWKFHTRFFSHKQAWVCPWNCCLPACLTAAHNPDVCPILTNFSRIPILKNWQLGKQEKPGKRKRNQRKNLKHGIQWENKPERDIEREREREKNKNKNKKGSKLEEENGLEWRITSQESATATKATNPKPKRSESGRASERARERGETKKKKKRARGRGKRCFRKKPQRQSACQRSHCCGVLRVACEIAQVREMAC